MYFDSCTRTMKHYNELNKLEPSSWHKNDFSHPLLKDSEGRGIFHVSLLGMRHRPRAGTWQPLTAAPPTAAPLHGVGWALTMTPRADDFESHGNGKDTRADSEGHSIELVWGERYEWSVYVMSNQSTDGYSPTQGF